MNTEEAYQLLQQLSALRDKVKNIFAENSIYWGAVDIRRSDDVFIDEIDDFMPTGLRFCFSSHDHLLTIPFAVLEDISKLGNFKMTLQQSGAVSSKSLYLYLNMDYTDDQMLKAEF